MTAHTWNDMREIAVKASRGEVHSHALLEQISAFSDAETAAKVAAERERIAQAIERRVPSDRPPVWKREWLSGLRAGMDRSAAIVRDGLKSASEAERGQNLTADVTPRAEQ